MISPPSVPVPPTPNASPEENEALVNELIAILKEVEEKPCRQIRLIVEYCGAAFAREILQATLETEANGGMMLPDETRRRTIGGVYFYLARHKMTNQLQKRIFPFNVRKPRVDIMPAPPQPPLKWNERKKILNALLESHGEVKNVKVILTGRPGTIETRKDLVITTMTHDGRFPTLPRGVPTPPEEATRYTVYISAKQWKRVEQPITHPDDYLIIEGVCAFDPAINGIAVFANSVTTQQLEKKRRAKADSEVPEDNDAAAPPPSPRPPVLMNKPSRIAETLQTVAETATPPAQIPIPTGMPAEESEKLLGLHASARAYRQKITDLENKPEGQRFGLEMTRKLLKKVEDDIVAIEKHYPAD